jgi:transcription-repair coupling factor (superfamily II helicase)
MIDKTIVRALGALAYELAPTRIVLSFAPDAALDPTKVTKLVSTRGSRFKLTPDMRLAYNFDDREKLDRMPAARARLEQLKNLVAG